MTVIFPFHQGDVLAMRELLLWLGQLGGAKQHDALLVADSATQWSECLAVLELAHPSFRQVELICTPAPVSGWPAGANMLFQTAAIEMKRRNEPFLWLEADAIPLRVGLIDAIATAYLKCGKALLGRLYKSNDKGIPNLMLSGIAVYPPDILDRVKLNGKAFDVTISEKCISDAATTKLIQWFWGNHHLAPTFSAKKDAASTVNTFTLETLEPEAMLFHRNKDGTLLDLLRARYFPHHSQAPFTVVLPFYRDDAALALRLLEWIARLGSPVTHEILLSYESNTHAQYIGPIVRNAMRSFTRVHQSTYRKPPRNMNPPTVAFFHAASVMKASARSFLWMEPDCVPLKANWLETLQTEYDRCLKPFCGPVVPFRGHMNGTGIYPADTVDRIPIAYRSQNEVWDWKMKNEMINDCHDCSHIFFHVWGEVNGRLNPIEGSDADFRNPALRAQIPEQAVILHHSKNGSLLDVLSRKL